jgi:hypothetical protein
MSHLLIRLVYANRAVGKYIYYVGMPPLNRKPGGVSLFGVHSAAGRTDGWMDGGMDEGPFGWLLIPFQCHRWSCSFGPPAVIILS